MGICDRHSCFDHSIFLILRIQLWVLFEQILFCSKKKFQKNFVDIAETYIFMKY